MEPPKQPASLLEVPDDVKKRIDAFKADVKNENIENIIGRHIIFGSCYMLSDSQYFKLKQVVAKNFAVHSSEVVVVGSAKLGFSIASGKRFRAFSDTSDIDVAVISSAAFDSIWQSVFEFKCAHGYWEKESQFNSYLARGWIRPDMLPPANKFEQCSRWWEFFRELSKSRQFGSIKISAGLYRNWRFLEAYQALSVSQCIMAEKVENENQNNGNK